MTEEFFDRLTNPRADRRALRHSAPDEGCRQLAEELEPVLDLLARGAPDNGIDLVPRWERYLSEQRHLPPQQPVRGFRFVRYAAAVALGVALGAMAAFPLGTTPVGAHYSPAERDLMFALLEDRQPTTGTLASSSLARCVTCHETALKGRLATR